jgi:hypothetical protein
MISAVAQGGVLYWRKNPVTSTTQCTTDDRYVQVKFYLDDMSGCPVDLVMADTLKPRAHTATEIEQIIALENGEDNGPGRFSG